jgi:hypothetical protein
MITIVPGGKAIYSSHREEERDVTELSHCYLFEPVSIADDVVLEDILKLVNVRADIYKSIIGNWCELFVEEGLNKEPDHNKSDLEYLELAMKAINDSSFDFPLKSQLSNTIVLEFTGYKDGTCYSLMFTKPQNIRHIPLKLNKEFRIIDEGRYYKDLRLNGYKLDSIDFSKYEVAYDICDYSFGQLLYSIFWELSFSGPPEQRDIKNEELNRRASNIDLEECFTMDEVRDMLKVPKTEA